MSEQKMCENKRDYEVGHGKSSGAARATPPPACHGEVPHHIAGVRNYQLINWYDGNGRAIPSADRTVFWLPCQFPAKPSILVDCCPQVYDNTRFFETGALRKKFLP
jgi:hypothetical protein